MYNPLPGATGALLGGRQSVKVAPALRGLGEAYGQPLDGCLIRSLPLQPQLKVLFHRKMGL